MGRVRININYIQLRTMYLIDKKPLKEIARYFGVSTSKIITELHRTGILDNDIHTTKEEHCAKCKYRVLLSNDVICNYILVEKENRGCDARHCFRFEEGTPKRENEFTERI